MYKEIKSKNIQNAFRKTLLTLKLTELKVSLIIYKIKIKSKMFSWRNCETAFVRFMSKIQHGKKF